ncbi:MAG: tetratricopeptide repeat protein [Candidatus Zixiibacteriota bacterium]
MVSVSELDDRIAKCEKILEADPNSQIFAALAEAYRRKGQLDKAFRICQNGLRIHPSYGSAHIVMAKINLDRRMYDWAEIEAKKALEIDGQTRSIRLLLAEIHIYRGQTEAAVKLLKQLSEADPDNTQIRRLLDISLRIPKEQPAGAGPSTQPQARSAVAESERAPAQPDTLLSLTEGDVIRLGRQIPGVSGALYVNSEGLIVESNWSAGVDATACAAGLSEVGNSVNQELVESSFGRVHMMLIETEDLVFYLVRAGGGSFLFAAEESVNLGTLRLQMERLLSNYHQDAKETAWK